MDFAKKMDALKKEWNLKTKIFLKVNEERLKSYKTKDKNKIRRLNRQTDKALDEIKKVETQVRRTLTIAEKQGLIKRKKQRK